MLFFFSVICYIFFLGYTPSYALARTAMHHVIGYAKGPQFESEFFKSITSQEAGFESSFFKSLNTQSQDFIQACEKHFKLSDVSSKHATGIQTLPFKTKRLHAVVQKHIRYILRQEELHKSKLKQKKNPTLDKNVCTYLKSRVPDATPSGRNLSRAEAILIFTDILRCIENEQDALVAGNIWKAISQGFEEDLTPWSKRIASVSKALKNIKDIHPYIIRAVYFLKNTALEESYPIHWIPEIKQIHSLIRELRKPLTFKEAELLAEPLVIVRQHIDAIGKITTHPDRTFFINAFKDQKVIDADRREQRVAIKGLGKMPSIDMTLHELMLLLSDFLRCIESPRDIQITRDLWAAIHDGFYIKASSSKRSKKSSGTWPLRISKVCRALGKKEGINPYIQKALILLTHSYFDNVISVPHHFQINAIDGFIQLFKDTRSVPNENTWLNPLINVRTHIFNKATPFTTNIAEQKRKLDDMNRRRTGALLNKAQAHWPI